MEATFSKYLENAPELDNINYWNLPKSIFLELNPIPRGVKLRGKSLTVRKLISIYGKNPLINKNILSILFYRGKRRLAIKFPFSLNNINFVRLYSLMASEGSNNTEFRLHVPEYFFHKMFADDLKELFGKGVRKYLIQKKRKRIFKKYCPHNN
jgi:hypothetical protein